MSRADVGDAPISAERSKDTDAQFLKQRRVLPHISGNVVFTDKVDIKRRGFFWLPGSNQVRQHRLATETAAEILAADKTSCMHRHHRHTMFFYCLLTDQINIVTDQSCHASSIDKYRLRRIALHNVVNRLGEFFFTAEDNIIQRDICAEAHLRKIATTPTGAGGPGFPGCPQTCYGAMHKVCSIRIGEKSNLCSFKGTAACCRSGRWRIARNLSGFVVQTSALVEQIFDFRFGCHDGLTPRLN